MNKGKSKIWKLFPASKFIILSGFFLFSALIYFFPRPGDVKGDIDILPPFAPLIEEFSVTPDKILLGGRITMEWRFDDNAKAVIDKCSVSFFLRGQPLPKFHVSLRTLDSPLTRRLDEIGVKEIGEWQALLCCTPLLGGIECSRPASFTVKERPSYKFRAEPDRIRLNETTTLRWNFDGADECSSLKVVHDGRTLDDYPGWDIGGPLGQTIGTRSINPNAVGTWIFHILCRYQGVRLTAEATVIVENPVDIVFKADPERITLNEQTTLKWDFKGVTCYPQGVEHNDGGIQRHPKWLISDYPLPTTGTRDIRPDRAGTWTFHIFCRYQNGYGSLRAKATVIVEDPDGNGNVCTRPLVPCGPGRPVVHCQFCHIFVLLSNIIEFILICLVAPIAIIILVIGALLLMFSGGSPELLKRAKAILKSVIIGLVIIYGAWLFISAFLSMIGVAEWTGLGRWFEIPCPVDDPADATFKHDLAPNSLSLYNLMAYE